MRASPHSCPRYFLCVRSRRPSRQPRGVGLPKKSGQGYRAFICGSPGQDATPANALVAVRGVRLACSLGRGRGDDGHGSRQRLTALCFGGGSERDRQRRSRAYRWARAFRPAQYIRPECARQSSLAKEARPVSTKLSQNGVGLGGAASASPIPGRTAGPAYARPALCPAGQASSSQLDRLGPGWRFRESCEVSGREKARNCAGLTSTAAEVDQPALTVCVAAAYWASDCAAMLRPVMTTRGS